LVAPEVVVVVVAPVVVVGEPLVMVTGPFAAVCGPFAVVVVVVVVMVTTTRYTVALTMIWPHSRPAVLLAPVLGRPVVPVTGVVPAVPPVGGTLLGPALPVPVPGIVPMLPMVLVLPVVPGIVAGTAPVVPVEPGIVAGTVPVVPGMVPAIEPGMPGMVPVVPLPPMVAAVGGLIVGGPVILYPACIKH
jgi:hypothetical protein